MAKGRKKVHVEIGLKTAKELSGTFHLFSGSVPLLTR